MTKGNRLKDESLNWPFSGCLTKNLAGIRFKDGCFNVGGITTSRAANGKISEERVNMDALGMRQ
jgi:hypothetical protein